MKQSLTLAAVLCVFSAAVLPVAAVEAEQAVNVRLIVMSQGPQTIRGNIATRKIVKSRITSKDVIQAIGEATGIQFGPRARLIQKTLDFGLAEETVSVAIRELGWEDYDVTRFFTFDGSETNFVEASTFDRSRQVWLRYLERETAALTIAPREDTYLALFGIFTTSGRLVRVSTPTAIIEGTVETVASKVVGDLIASGEFAGVVDGSVAVGPAKFLR